MEAYMGKTTTYHVTLQDYAALSAFVGILKNVLAPTDVDIFTSDQKQLAQFLLQAHANL